LLRNLKRAVAAAWLLALGACGFTPLYGGQTGDDVSAQLEQVKIAPIPERTGQLLQQSLQDAMQRQGQPTTQLYVLTVDYSINVQGIGIQADSSSTRNRYVATAKWTLAPIGAPDTVMANGNATTENAENVIDSQYFASELETGTVNQQLADQLAAQITGQVAVYFRAHPAG
jgi:LPS-assembly lipoprotein